MNPRPSFPIDEASEALSAFVVEAPRAIDEAALRAARLALFDTFAVALGALDHPAAQAGRRYAQLYPMADGAAVWGTRLRTTPEAAALVNSAPLRAYDYNDLYIGAKNGGHPSDIIPALIAVAEWRGLSGATLLNALVLGYEAALNLFDCIAAGKGGWDYTNLTGLAATCAVARLMGLSREQVVEALAIAVVPHAASNEIESGDLNRRGDLTMWKRFNGGDAVRQAVYACTLASVGVEGAVKPFVGKCGFLTKVNVAPDALAQITARFHPGQPLTRVGEATFKRWPVGSRAQSAIQASLEARQGIADLASIREVRVFTQEGVYDHLVRSRQDPWHPASRETADHSLPYVVAAAVMDGAIDTDSFEPANVTTAARRAMLDKVKVEVEEALHQASPGEWLTRVEIHCADGSVRHGRAAPPPGHPKRPFSEADMLDKLRANAEPVLGVAGVRKLVDEISRLPDAKSVAALVSCLSGDPA